MCSSAAPTSSVSVSRYVCCLTYPTPSSNHITGAGDLSHETTSQRRHPRSILRRRLCLGTNCRCFLGSVQACHRSIGVFSGRLLHIHVVDDPTPWGSHPIFYWNHLIDCARFARKLWSLLHTTCQAPGDDSFFGLCWSHSNDSRY